MRSTLRKTALLDTTEGNARVSVAAARAACRDACRAVKGSRAATHLQQSHVHNVAQAQWYCRRAVNGPRERQLLLAVSRVPLRCRRLQLLPPWVGRLALAPL